MVIILLILLMIVLAILIYWMLIDTTLDPRLIFFPNLMKDFPKE